MRIPELGVFPNVVHGIATSSRYVSADVCVIVKLIPVVFVAEFDPRRTVGSFNRKP